MHSQVLVYILLIFSIDYAFITEAKYTPDWESLDTRPVPQWYKDAKIGIILHWGVYSVPSFGTEWFWANWKKEEDPEYEDFMKKNYKPDFTYQDFANEFTAELFNATQWANLFSDSGARYVVLTGKHYDGFTLWPSKESPNWNSLDVGPKRDLVGELSVAVRSQNNLKFGVYYSLVEWFNRMYIDDKSHDFKKRSFLENKVWPELKDLVENYLPDILWTPGHWEEPTYYWNSEEFIAWLYNDSPVRNTVLINGNMASFDGCLHGDIKICMDYSNLWEVRPENWEYSFKLDKTSWKHRFDTTLSDYMSSEEVIANIVRTVSCNGNVLINIGPTKYGTISPIFEERLRDMGHWLKINGEAIYGSKPWIYQEDNFTPNVWYTSNREKDILYAIILNYPYDTNELELQPFGEFGMNSKSYSLTLLGMEDTPINWKFNNDTIHIQMPPKHLIDKRKLQFAWTFKISINKYDEDAPCEYLEELNTSDDKAEEINMLYIN